MRDAWKPIPSAMPWVGSSPKKFNDVTCYYIPVRTGETRIERIYTGDRRFDELKKMEKELGKVSGKCKEKFKEELYFRS